MSNDSQSRSARRKQAQSTKKGKNKKTGKVKRIFMILFTIGLLLALGVGLLFSYYIVTAPELDASKLSVPFSSKVYDQNDELVADLASDEKRTKITYDDIPQVMEDAVLATEDVRFYDHMGIDFRRIGGAVIANITGGFGAQGASTITQQVVKESFLSQEKTLKRKVQEQYLAIKLDQEYTKEEILEMYLNKIYYGDGAYGVAVAAETYFGKKDLSELTLPEAALLAGLPQRPSGYMPYDHPDLAQKRKNTVLSLMVQHGKITEAEAEEARNVKVEDMLVERQTEKATPYQAFIDRVEEEVREKMDGAEIYEDGLKIYTTLDTDAQDNVQQMLSNEGPIAWPDDELQTSLAVTDTKTGAIRAIGGGRNYQKGGYNYATDINRQPGSTFKPITAYGPAIEYDKISTYHQIKDEKTDFGNWSPNNFDNQFRGWVSARYALSRSLNIPAIKTLQEVGVGKGQDFAEGLGIDFGEDGMALNDAIGGGNTGVNPVQLAGAYAAFGNEGVYNEPFTVRKVEVPGEGTIDLTPEPESAMSSYTAYMISDMLKTTMTEGSGRAANISGLPVAGKTGTTNFGDVAPDSWFSGYTTNYTISIWTGYGEDNSRGLSDASKDIPKQIFKPLMTELSQGVETKDFSKPDTVVSVDVEEGSNPARLPSAYTPESRIVTELFHVDNQPSKVSKTFQKLDSVKGLAGKFNEETGSIDLSWKYGDADGVTFRVAASIDGGESRELTTTGDTSLEITNVNQGSSYEFSVTAISSDEDAQNSDPATVRVDTPGSNEEPEEEAEEEQDESQEENTEEQQEDDQQQENEQENQDQNEGSENGQGNESEDGSDSSDQGSNDQGNGGQGENNNGSDEQQTPEPPQEEPPAQDQPADQPDQQPQEEPAA
ncbi:PBP1A family penicillin-binding protein [Bacillus sp. SB49]|uniref:PBP1A family penicillin-binding protein n=1 Tax=Bacillaceae TaxID=186817 RepID=UPI0004279827|nr:MULTISPECIES: PBP1A family penicillin-binding protein [Bacillaceae]QHT46838.1 PBP1A family penicillin-binding protein [Bacillus sp. SB49]